eukprot:scaffold1053_cov107-Isochrysis_galbana.AAC.13
MAPAPTSPGRLGLARCPGANPGRLAHHPISAWRASYAPAPAPMYASIGQQPAHNLAPGAAARTCVESPVRLKSSWMKSSSTSTKNSLPLSEQNHETQVASSLSDPERSESSSEQPEATASRPGV